MKKLLIGIALLVLVAAGDLIIAPSLQMTLTPAPQVQVAPAVVKGDPKIIVEGKVVPAASADLAFASGGMVAETLTAAGQQVQAGKALARLDTRILELELVQQEANLAAAQARLNQHKNGPSAEEVEAASQNVVAAQAAYYSLLHPSEGELIALKTDMEKSKALLDQAVAIYDRVGGDSSPDAGMLPQRAQVQTAWLDYTRTQAEYNARLKPANADVQQALADLQNAKNGQAGLNPTADELAEAQADLAGAQAARDLAAERLENARLLAPFAGTVISFDARVGVYVAPGVPILRLADLSAWQVETTDLTESNIAKIREGMPVTLTFDAIPGFELPGTVSYIKPFGENNQGDIVYTVVVTPDRQDARLRWNMTAKVTIEEAQ